MISTLLSTRHGVWVNCNVEMSSIITSLWMGVVMKPLGLAKVFTKDCFAPSPPYCKICSVLLFYVNTCVVHMYYVVHKHEYLTWVEIHLGTYDHPMVENMCREVMDQIKALVHENESCTPSAIVLAISKTFCPNTCSMKIVMGQWNFWKETNYAKWWMSSQPSILLMSRIWLHPLSIL
jgi:hypothetical protein